MKIAAVTNDGRTISAHFGRARAFVVITVEDGTIVGREERDRSAPSDIIQEQAVAAGQTQSGGSHHDRAIAPITDCNVVLSRGMGAGMHMNLQQARIRPILTDIVEIDAAVTALLEGRLQNRPDLVH